MSSASDREIWQYAKEEGYTIVTKDDDFHHLAHTLGHPPKVIALRIGNCTTDQIAHLLQDHFEGISHLHEADAGVIELEKPTWGHNPLTAA